MATTNATIGRPILSSLTSQGDVNAYLYTLTAGTSYSFRLQDSQAPLGDVALRIRDSSGTILGSVVQDGDLVFTPSAGGQYRVEVLDRVNDGEGEGQYYLTSQVSTQRAVVGTADNNLMSGAGRNNLMVGRAGDDLLMGVGGNDTLIGGPGNDILNGGDGIDTAFYTGGARVTVDLRLTGFQSTEGYGADRLIGIENIRGSTVDDRIIGNGLANDLRGGAGNDRIEGQGGNDRLQGDQGNDLLIGGAGFDTAVFSRGGDVVVDLNATGYQATGEGIDRLIGIEGAATGGGNDRLTGNAGANHLAGGLGNDTLLGGAGNDTLNGGRQHDRIDGGAGHDVLELSANSDHRVDLRITTRQSTGEGFDTITGMESIVSLGRGSDELTGTNLDNLLAGGNGGDTLRGLGGTDTLQGDAGRDFLIGGDGRDHLTGGADVDRFIFDLADGQDTIADFEVGIDRFAIDGPRSTDIDIGQEGAHVRVSFGTTSVLIQNVQESQIHESDFLFV